MIKHTTLNISKLSLYLLERCLNRKDELRISLKDLCECLMIKELYSSKLIWNEKLLEGTISITPRRFQYEPLIRDSDDASRLVLTFQNIKYYIKTVDFHINKPYSTGIQSNAKLYLSKI